MKSGLSGVVRENSKQKNIITVASTADKVSSEFLYKYYAYYCATRHTIVVSRMFTFCASLSSGIVPPALRNKSLLRVIRGLSEPCKALGEMQTKMTVLLSSAMWIIQIAKTPPLRAPSSSPPTKGGKGRSGLSAALSQGEAGECRYRKG